MNRFCSLLSASFLLGLILVSTIIAMPQQINYQGRIASPAGIPVADGSYSVKFSIYSASVGGSLLWSETLSVTTKSGLFSVTLGAGNDIEPVVFDGSIRYLGIQVGADPELTARVAIVSVAYAYQAGEADTADYVRNSGSITCGDCSPTFVNVIGPDSVYVTVGTAFLGKASGMRTTDLYGLQGYANNTSTGDAHGGRFSTSSSGTGVHYALSADAAGSSSAAAYGLNSTASNSSSGAAYGAALTVEAGGTGVHYGANIHSNGAGAGGAFGVWSEAENTSAGTAYGGYFRTTTAGTGSHYGVSGNASGASDGNSYSIYGYSTNTGTGDSYGGYFLTGTTGTGVHYGLKSDANGGSSSAVHGINSVASNTSTGSAYGGTFTAESAGDGRHYGVYSQSTGSSSLNAYGVYGTADNTGSGETYGGFFAAGSQGTGKHYGVSAAAYNDDNHDCFGIFSYAQNTYQGDYYQGNAYAGYFLAQTTGNGERWGIYAEAADAVMYESWAGYFAGNVRVEGDYWVWGSKSAAVKVEDDSYRALYCQESPENWFEDFGEGQLVDGRAHIELDQLYLQTVTISNEQPMKVFIQLNDENCNGSAVKRGASGFDVIELQNGTSNAAFSYRVVAKRRGYENKRLEVAPGPTPEEMSIRKAKIHSQVEAGRAEHITEQLRLREEQAASKAKLPTEENR